MKIDQIPDIYIEQYLLGELPENLRKEMDILIPDNPELNHRITEMKKSNEDILSSYPVQSMTAAIMERKEEQEISSREYASGFRPADDSREVLYSSRPGLTASLKNILNRISSLSARRYTLSLASAAVMMLVIIFMIPGIRNTDNLKIPADDSVRIKGLDSKLLLYRMKGREVEELKNLTAARKGDVVQVGYIAAGDYRHGMILSIDGRGTVTMHLPYSTASGDELVMNKRILLNKSYELDDSPSFERFIMILSADPINTAEIVEKAKKLAISRESAENGSIETGKNTVEFSIIIKKRE
jgi:hypothetical protein